MYETDYLTNIKNHLYDLQDLVNEVIELRAENATLKKQVADYDEFDMLIGMDSSNIRRMHSFFNGDPDGKICRLLDFTDRKGADVADPWYSGDFETTYRDVVAGCSALLAELLNKR